MDDLDRREAYLSAATAAMESALHIVPVLATSRIRATLEVGRCTDARSSQHRRNTSLVACPLLIIASTSIRIMRPCP